MSLDNGTNAQPSSSNNSGKTNVSQNPLFALIGSQNLISSSSTITEVSDIVKSITETLKALNTTTASEAQKLALPETVVHVTAEISPNLPGITLSRIIGDVAFVSPVLFFKAGVTDVTESIYLANEAVPRGIAKPATSFMDHGLLEKVKTQYSYRDGKQLSRVVIVSPQVINLEAYVKNSVKYEEMIDDVRNVILSSWSAGLVNIVYLDAAKADFKLGSPFKDGKLFGKDDTAVARIEPVHKLSIDGRPVPYNLAVKVSTTNKNGTQNQNSAQTKSVATGYLTVSLEAMSQQQFLQARAQNPGKVVGPLVPVISTGLTVPGETLNNNSSILTALLGLYAGIGANNINYFSEAFRGKEVGNRGNVGNFNNYLTQVMQGAFGTAQAITDKNITNAQVMNNWLGTYIAPNAVYVLDLPTFSGDMANADFFWNLVSKPAGSVYHRAFTNVLDILTNNKFSEIAAKNAANPQRNNRVDWAPGDAILKPTNIMLPAGIAQGKDGKWFDLAEVDGMFLRQDQYYGSNEIAVNEYQALVCGAAGGDQLKVRQFNIYTRLNQLFGANVIVESWNRRAVWENAFFNTFTQAMSSAGVLSLSGSNMAQMLTMNAGNDYLNYAITTVLNQNPQAAVAGFGSVYTQY